MNFPISLERAVHFHQVDHFKWTIGREHSSAPAHRRTLSFALTHVTHTDCSALLCIRVHVLAWCTLNPYFTYDWVREPSWSQLLWMDLQNASTYIMYSHVPHVRAVRIVRTRPCDGPYLIHILYISYSLLHTYIDLHISFAAVSCYSAVSCVNVLPRYFYTIYDYNNLHSTELLYLHRREPYNLHVKTENIYM